MEDLLKVLDKLIELGRVYGKPGLAVAAAIVISLKALEAGKDFFVEDRKNRRDHDRAMVRLNEQLDRRRKKSKAKDKGNG